MCVCRVVLIALTVACCGCAPSRELSDGINPSDRLGQVPEDLSIDAMVLLGRDVEPGANDLTRPGRFMLMPDATLRYTPDPQPRAHKILPRVRRLSREQIATLWSGAIESGLAEPPASPFAIEMGNPALIEPPAAGQIVHVLTIYGGERHWTTVRRFAAGEQPDPHIGALIESLAALAWVEQYRSVQRQVVPQRSDFGPDPYARYRGHETADER